MNCAKKFFDIFVEGLIKLASTFQKTKVAKILATGILSFLVLVAGLLTILADPVYDNEIKYGSNHTLLIYLRHRDFSILFALFGAANIFLTIIISGVLTTATLAYICRHSLKGVKNKLSTYIKAVTKKNNGTVNYCYTGLGYTGIRTYRTENFSPAQKQLTVCSVPSGIQIYRISYIPDSKSWSQPQSGIRPIDCNKNIRIMSGLQVGIFSRYCSTYCMYVIKLDFEKRNCWQLLTNHFVNCRKLDNWRELIAECIHN